MLAVASAVALTAAVGVAQGAELSLDALGRALFFDTNLSAARTLSCASCHDPSRGFIDARDNGVRGAVSRGDDGRALGDRNAPSAAYAALVPPFSRDPQGEYVGGLFHDGRARDLVEQADAHPRPGPVRGHRPDHDRALGFAKRSALTPQLPGLLSPALTYM